MQHMVQRVQSRKALPKFVPAAVQRVRACDGIACRAGVICKERCLQDEREQGAGLAVSPVGSRLRGGGIPYPPHACGGEARADDPRWRGAGRFPLRVADTGSCSRHASRGLRSGPIAEKCLERRYRALLLMSGAKVVER